MAGAWGILRDYPGVSAACNDGITQKGNAKRVDKKQNRVYKIF